MKNIPERVDPDSPIRCQGICAGKFQCNNKQVPGSKFCLLHGGGKVSGKDERKELRLYAFHKFQDRIDKFCDHSEHLDLSMELALLRQLLEALVNRASDLNDLLMYSPQIQDLVIRIEKLVSSMNKLEKELGGVLDKGALMQMVSEILNIISSSVTDESTLAAIATGIGNLLKNKTKNREQSYDDLIPDPLNQNPTPLDLEGFEDDIDDNFDANE